MISIVRIGAVASTIVVRSPDEYGFTEDLGVTRSIVDHDTREILSAEIEVYVVRERVLEHELGHALGIKHVFRSGHIMHPEWNSGGWNNEGLRR